MNNVRTKYFGKKNVGCLVLNGPLTSLNQLYINKEYFVLNIRISTVNTFVYLSVLYIIYSRI